VFIFALLCILKETKRERDTESNRKETPMVLFFTRKSIAYIIGASAVIHRLEK